MIDGKENTLPSQSVFYSRRRPLGTMSGGKSSLTRPKTTSLLATRPLANQARLVRATAQAFSFARHPRLG
jgi:hypothetical protein